MFGYHGAYLRIDPRPGRTEWVELPESVLRSFVGGVGLGTWLLAHESRPGLDPLDPDAPLIFALSPLVGSPLTTSAKFAVVAKGPLTDRVCDALSSSHFALAAKRTGVDALVLTGACDEPMCVFVEGGDPPSVRWLPAGDLWGLPAAEAERRLRDRFGTDWQVSAIGPAGEAQIPFATISHDGRHAGRGGLGAVLGSKRIKAILVRGARRTPLADPARVVELARSLSARSLGPATAKYRELGTVANLLVFNRFSALPSRNFAESRLAEAEALVPEDLAPARSVARRSCAACTIGCEHIYPTPGKGSARMEYETLWALGPMCGVTDPSAVLAAAETCDRLGLDTISTGGTLAFLMTCAERGLIEAPIRFGDAVSLLEAIESIPRREGIGELAALGSRRAAQAIGQGSEAWAMQVKGLELPGYDPRALHTMALGLAVGTRGADHNRSGAYEADFSGALDRLDGGPAHARAAVETEDKAALIDSLILCKFLRGVFSDLYAESAEMLRVVTGWDFDSDELRKVASRVVTARKCLNRREGWTRAEDTLPPALLSERSPTPDRPALSKEHLVVMIEAYHRVRGWEPDGTVGPEARRSLGLEDPTFGPSLPAALPLRVH